MKRFFAFSLILCFVLMPSAAFSDEPEDFDELFKKGMEALQEKKYDESIQYFQKTIEMNPDEPASYYNIACAYSLKQDLANAIVWLQKSIEKGFDKQEHIDSDTDLDNIRNTEEFKKLMQKAFPSKKAPALTLPDLKGNKISLASFSGKIVILDFWATWCPPCRREIPHFIELQAKYKDKGLAIIGISEEEIEVLKEFEQENKINYTLLYNPDEIEFPEPFSSVQSIPTTFVIDQQGFIRKKFVGYQSKEVFEKEILALLPKAKEIDLVKIMEKPMPGGYAKQDPDSPEIKEVAEKVAEILCKDLPGYRLAKTHKAASQVVAGMNFYLVLELENQEKKARSLWQVIVYRDFGNNLQITEKKEVE